MSTSETLMQALNFDADELATNRAGRMSDFQRERLRTRGLSAIVIVGIAALIFSLVTIGLIASDDEEGRCFIIPFGAASALLIYVVLAQVYGLLFETKHETVSSIEGRAETEVQTTQTASGRQKRSEYLLIIHPDEGEKRHYSVNIETYNAIESGGRYRLYYSPKTLVPLSAEKLETA